MAHLALTAVLDACRELDRRGHSHAATHVRHRLAGALGVTGVSSQDTPPPPRRQWAVQHPKVITTAHNSEWSALYTLSKLPGGVLVTRDHPGQPWRPETECVCITVPDTGHYAGCPAAPVSTDTDGADR